MNRRELVKLSVLGLICREELIDRLKPRKPYVYGWTPRTIVSVDPAKLSGDKLVICVWNPAGAHYVAVTNSRLLQSIDGATWSTRVSAFDLDIAMRRAGMKL